MIDEAVDAKVLAIALNEVSTTDFERFGQAFYASVEGRDFVPLGGAGDGGADGLHDRSVFETSDRSRVLQISKQDSLSTKVAQTVKRLRDYGRAPISLTYLTGCSVQNLDTKEDDLSDKHGIRIRIRDSRYIESHINGSVGTRAAARSFLLPAASFLNQIGARPIIAASDELPVVSLCAFVGQEVESRRGNTALLESVTDSLILWGLNDTDPDNNRFKARKELLSEIETALPAAKKFIRSIYNMRLDRLSRKDRTDGRKINYYPKDDKFCLPTKQERLLPPKTLLTSTLSKGLRMSFARER